MKHIRKITTSLTLTALLALGVATAAYAACDSEAKKLYDAAATTRFQDANIPPIYTRRTEYQNSKDWNLRKTLAAVRSTNGTKISYYVSGWSNSSISLSTKNLKQVSRSKYNAMIFWGEATGFVFEKSTTKDQGIPGSESASHSEIQALFENPDVSEIGVSTISGKVCEKCRPFIKNYAKKKGRDIVVMSDYCVYKFKKDGGKTEITNRTTTTNCKG